jgi:hypothetical protein
VGNFALGLIIYLPFNQHPSATHQGYKLNPSSFSFFLPTFSTVPVPVPVPVPDPVPVPVPDPDLRLSAENETERFVTYCRMKLQNFALEELELPFLHAQEFSELPFALSTYSGLSIDVPYVELLVIVQSWLQDTRTGKKNKNVVAPLLVALLKKSFSDYSNSSL